MLAIKLKRIGKKHQPSYRVVVQEKRTKLDGLDTEDLGWFNPLQSKREINKERILYWIGVGAKPTTTVHNLLVTEGIIKGPKIPVHKKSKKVEETSDISEKTESHREVISENTAPIIEGTVFQKEPFVEEKKEASKSEEVKDEPKAFNKETSTGE